MNEVFVVAAAQGSVPQLSGEPHAEQVRPVLQDLLRSASLAPQQVQEFHWIGGDQEYWLSSLGTAVAFPPEMARFQWPPASLLAHYVLQSCMRAIQSAGRDLILVGQETGDQALALLLASPGAAKQAGLSPLARLGPALALSAAPDGLLNALHAGLEKSGQDRAPVQWLAAARRLGAVSAIPGFSSAQWIQPDASIPPGDLFLLRALVNRLAETPAQRGLLVSEGPQRSGLATQVERV